MAPTKQDYIAQIEADLQNETEPEEVLTARLATVEAAETDDEAKVAYFAHVSESQ